MHVLAISNYPTDFNEGKILPELKSRGILDVKFITSNSFKEIQNTSDVSGVVCFFDLMSHGQYDNAKIVAKKAKKPFILLTRKSATWPEESLHSLRSKPPIKDTKLAPPRSVEEKNIEPMLRRYMALVNSNASPDEFVSELSRFWTGRSLNTYNQIKTYIDRIKTGRSVSCPDFFKNWLDGNVEDIPKSEEPSTERQDVDVVQSPSSPGSDSNLSYEEAQELIVLYQTDLKLLKQENAELLDRLRRKDSELETAKRSNSSSNTKEAFVAIKKLIELGIMDVKEGLERLELII